MTDTYISDEMVEAVATHLEIDFDGDEPFIRIDSINAALEAIAPALIQKGMEKAAEIAEEYAYGPARAGDIAAQVADAIRTAKEEV